MAQRSQGFAHMQYVAVVLSLAVYFGRGKVLDDYSQDDYDYSPEVAVAVRVRDDAVNPSELQELRVTRDTLMPGCLKDQPCCMCRPSEVMRTCVSPKKKVLAEEVNFTNMKKQGGGAFTKWTTNLCCKWVRPPVLKSEKHQSDACYGFLVNDWYHHPCESDAHGKPVYPEAGAARVKEIVTNGWARVKAIVKASVGAAKKLYAMATYDAFKKVLLTAATAGANAIKELLTKRPVDWWSVLKFATGLTIVIVTLACPQCSVGAAIAGGAWKLVKAGMGAAALYNKRDVNGTRLVSNTYIATSFAFGVVGAVAGVLSGFMVDVDYVFEVLKQAPNMWLGLLETCKIMMSCKNDKENMAKIFLDLGTSITGLEELKDVKDMRSVTDAFKHLKSKGPPTEEKGVACDFIKDNAEKTEEFKSMPAGIQRAPDKCMVK